jgi:hypothetical protein
MTAENVQLQDQEIVSEDATNDQPENQVSNAPSQEVQLSDAIVKKIAEESAKAFRAMQSMKDKKARQVMNETRKTIEQMRASGVEIDDAKAKAIERNALDKMTEDEEDAGNMPIQANPASTPDQGPSRQAGDAFNRAIQELYEEYGLTIDDKSPEDEKYRALLDMSSPRKFQKSLEKALEKKATDQKTPPEARIPTLAGSGKTTHPSADQYKNEMFAARGNAQKVREVKEKYKKLGLDVDSVSLFK